MATTLERVQKLLIEQLGVSAEQVTAEATLGDDLGCDSLDIVELEMAVEDEFAFRFPDQEASNFELGSTVDQITATIQQHAAG